MRIELMKMLKKYTSMPPLGYSSVHLRSPEDASQILTSPSKLPDASNRPSIRKCKLDTESL